jgi:hypothetical protein
MDVTWHRASLRHFITRGLSEDFTHKKEGTMNTFAQGLLIGFGLIVAYVIAHMVHLL